MNYPVYSGIVKVFGRGVIPNKDSRHDGLPVEGVNETPHVGRPQVVRDDDGDGHNQCTENPLRKPHAGLR